MLYEKARRPQRLHEDMGAVAALMDETQDQLEMERRCPRCWWETTDDSDLLAERCHGGACLGCRRRVVVAGGACLPAAPSRRRGAAAAGASPCPRDQIKFRYRACTPFDALSAQWYTHYLSSE